MSKKYALLIGTSEYEDVSFSSLKTPNADVESLAALLKEKEIGGFDQVTTLINQPFSEIYSQIGMLFSNKKKNDLIVFYYSGHGIRDDKGRLLLTAKNSRHDNQYGSTISSSYIKEQLYISNRVIIILDCCYSGAFSFDTKSDGKAIKKNDFVENNYGHIVMTATDSVEYANQGDNFSAFTSFIIEGLSSGDADINNDGDVSVNDIYTYVCDGLANSNMHQTPTLWAYNLKGDLVLAKKAQKTIRKEILDDLINDDSGTRLNALKKLVEIYDEGADSEPELGLLSYLKIKNIAQNNPDPILREAAQHIINPPKSKGRIWMSFSLLHSPKEKLEKTADEFFSKLISSIDDIENEVEFAWRAGGDRRDRWFERFHTIRDNLKKTHSEFKLLNDDLERTIKDYKEANGN